MKDRSLDCFAHKFGLGLSTQRVTSLGTALMDMISSVYNFLVQNFCTQGFLWGVLLCLKIGSWKEMNRVIFLWMLLFFCPSFLAKFFLAQSYEWMIDLKSSFQEKNNPHKLNLQEFCLSIHLFVKNLVCEAALCLIQDQSIFSEEKWTIKYVNMSDTSTLP